MTETPPDSTTRPRIYYPALDGLRAIALLLVFFAHYVELPWGWTGVEIFFVLSGFLITGILVDTLHADGANPHPIRDFYIRRTLRIFPLYYGAMLLILLAWPLFHWQLTWAWLLWPAYLGNYLRFIHAYAPHSAMEQLVDFQVVGHIGHQQVRLIFGHFWSLCVEEQFYLVWPWVVFTVRSRRALTWLCALSVPVCLCARIWLEHSLPAWLIDHEVLQRATPLHADALLLGGLLALLLRSEHAAQLFRYASTLLTLSTVAILAWFILTPARHLFANPYPYPAHTQTLGLTCIDLFTAVLILNLLQSNTLLTRAFNMPWLRWIGRVSYGAYIFHDVPHAFYARLAAAIAPQHATLADAFIGLACTLLLAGLSYRYFESPFLRLKDRLAPREAFPEPTPPPLHPSGANSPV